MESHLKTEWLLRVIAVGNYQITTDGRVIRATSRTCSKAGAEIRPHIYRGYKMITVRHESEKKLVPIHRLVALAHLPNPHNLPQVNHKNGIKTDNRVENLEWVTISENRRHAYATGLQRGPFGEKAGSAILKNEHVSLIRESVEPLKVLAARFGVKVKTIKDVKEGRTWTHL